MRAKLRLSTKDNVTIWFVFLQRVYMGGALNIIGFDIMEELFINLLGIQKALELSIYLRLPLT